MSLNIEIIRREFPVLDQKIGRYPLVYLDNAATTQKPRSVTDRLIRYYHQENSNIHRGAHFLSNQATEAYEKARRFIASFINAPDASQVIFTRGTTESINLVASSFSQRFIRQGDEVLISAMEHHSNIVPWQLACEQKGARLKVIPVSESGELDMQAFENLLGEQTRLLAITHVSNALGTINPVREIISLAHARSIPVLIDGAQAISHLKVDVQDLDCDFYCFSAHKVYGPMGTGVLYGKEEWLEQMPPWQGGGEMIREVRFEGSTYNELPFKFEAGTPNVGDVLGMQAALEFVQQTGYEAIASHEQDLLNYAIDRLSALEKIRFVGTARERASVISFLFTDIHPYDTGILLDKMGIAVRTGHHCAQPLMDHLGVPGTVRASLAVYNTRDEIDRLIEALVKIREMLA